jgi:hypothetical protein
MNVSTIASAAYQSAIDSVSEKRADSNKQSFCSNVAKSRFDLLEISEEAYDLQSKNDYYGNEFWRNTVWHNMEVARQQGEVYKKAAEDEAKALETARRIASGGKVPAEDEKKLIEYSPDLYAMAKMQAIMAEQKEHKKYDSLYKDDEKNKSGNESEDSELTSYENTVSVSMEDCV